MNQCSIDGFSFFGVVALGLFIATLGGLFSKDKSHRGSALLVGFGIAFGGFILYALVACQ